LIWLALTLNPSGVVTNDAVCGGKTKARRTACLFCRKKGLKDAFSRVPFNTNTVIDNIYAYDGRLLGRYSCMQMNGSSFLSNSLRSTDRIPCIGAEVGQALTQLRVISGNGVVDRALSVR